MFVKVQPRVKLTRMIGHNLFTDLCPGIQNNKSIDDGGPSLQAAGTRSSCLVVMFLKASPCVFTASNRCALIDDTPLPKKDKKRVFVCIEGIYFVFF